MVQNIITTGNVQDAAEQARRKNGMQQEKHVGRVAEQGKEQNLQYIKNTQMNIVLN
jgi:hypothetical protein